MESAKSQSLIVLSKDAADCVRSACGRGGKYIKVLKIQPDLLGRREQQREIKIKYSGIQGQDHLQLKRCSCCPWCSKSSFEARTQQIKIKDKSFVVDNMENDYIILGYLPCLQT